MSAAPRKAPREPSARPKLVPTPKMYPLPEIFWSENDEGDARDLAEPIGAVYVKRVGRNGKEDIATLGGDQITHRDQIREAFGPGTYELVARGERGSILARAVLTLGSVSAASDTAAQPASHVPYHVDPIVSSLIQSTQALASAVVTTSKEANATVITAITQLAGSRLTDQKELFHTLLKDRGGGAKGGELAAFMKGTEWIQELLDKHGGGDDDDEKPSELKELLDAFKEFRAMRKGVVDAPGG